MRAPSGKWEIDAAGRFITKLNTSEGEKAMYAIQSPTSEFIFSGSGNLQNGLAEVVFDTSTREIIDPDQPVKVNLTETSLETKGLVVIAKTATGFTVKEKENGASSAGFDWLVVAKRRNDQLPISNFQSNPNYQLPITSNETPASVPTVILNASEESLSGSSTPPLSVIPTEVPVAVEVAPVTEPTPAVEPTPVETAVAPAPEPPPPADPVVVVMP